MELLNWPSGLEWLAVIPMLAVLIFVHELGHFLAAIRTGVKVEEFGFGYPPRLLTLFERKGVKYTINLIPLGGFVRMAGEEGNFDAEGSLYRAKSWKRFIIFTSGPVMNLILAVLLFSFALFAIGMPVATGKIEVTSVNPDSPAARAGFEEGDILLEIGGTRIKTLSDVTQATDAHLGREVEVVLKRGDETLSVKLVPRSPEDRPANQGPMGIAITNEVIYTRLNLFEALVQGARQAFEVIVMILVFLSQVLKNLLFPTQAMPDVGLAGPIGIARLTGELVRRGWMPFLHLAAFLSLNFFLLNLLPLPALDGGRLVFVILEWLRRGKRISPEKEALVHLVGMALLISAMIVISYFDLIQWIRGETILP
ncbi:MAG: M50 family metallopeptidase [Anaerolineae bacterium]